MSAPPIINAGEVIAMPTGTTISLYRVTLGAFRWFGAPARCCKCNETWIEGFVGPTGQMDTLKKWRADVPIDIMVARTPNPATARSRFYCKTHLEEEWNANT